MIGTKDFNAVLAFATRRAVKVRATRYVVRDRFGRYWSTDSTDLRAFAQPATVVTAVRP